MTAQGASFACGSASLERQADRRSFPLSLNQRDLWLQGEVHGANHRVSVQVEIEGALDAPRFRRALQQVVDRHEALRTVFRRSAGTARQHVLADLAVDCARTDVRNLSAAGRAEAVTARDWELVSAPFSLAQGPLFRAELVRVDEGRHVFLFAFHHLVLDAFYLQDLLAELLQAYAADRAEPSAPPPLQYGDFAAWQDQRLRLGLLTPHAQYWRERLRSPLPDVSPPADFARRAGAAAPGFSGLEREPPLELSASLDAFARAWRTTPFRVVVAAFAALLHRLAGQDDVLLGLPVSARPRALRGVPGFFAHLVPLRLAIPAGRDFAALLADVDRLLRDARFHAEYPLSEALRGQPAGRGQGRPVFPVCVTQIGRAELAAGGLVARMGTSFVQGGAYDLMLALYEGTDRLRLAFCYDRGRFADETVVHLADAFEAVLEAVLRRPDAALSDAELAPACARAAIARLGDGGSAAGAEWPEDAIARHARARPFAVALACDGEEVTYGALSLRSDLLGAYLAARGIGREDRVGIMGRRGIGLWTAVLAVLKAGGAFVPLAAEEPVERLREIARRCGLAAILADDARLDLARALADDGCEVASWEGGAWGLAAGAPPVATEGRDRELVYVFHTSGSTGSPKGAMVERAGWRAHVAAKVAYLGLTDADVVVQNASHCFDVSVWQTFAALAVGARVEICADAGAHDPAAVLALVARSRATVLETVPSFLSLLLGCPGAAAALSGLRAVVSNAETLPVSLYERWLDLVGPEVRLANTWGATECSDDVTQVFLDPAERDRARLGVGRTIPGSRVYVVDDALRPLPAGCAGEVVVGGIAVGRGYAGEGASTAAAFVPDPLGGAPGSRLYRTGDRGRLRADGMLEFLGRGDGQVKVRGHRVEVGEVEGVLAAHPAVRQAAVEIRGGRLVGYWTGPVPVASAELRAWLAARLPSFMVPETYVALAELPVTRSGKLDRRALPEPSGDGAAAYAPPRTRLEAQLADVWRDVLGVERVGMNDDFFDLGGDSLHAARVAMLVRSRVGRELPIRTLFDRPTVAALAADGALPPANVEAIPRLPPAAGYALSPAQEAHWYDFHQVLAGPIAAWGFPAVLRVEGPLDTAVLQHALRRLVARHEALRTSFGEHAGVPVQVIHDEAEPVLGPLRDLSGFAEEERPSRLRALLAGELGAPYDGRPPQLRVSPVRLAPEHHLVLLQLPHIVTDGWSERVLVEDLAAIHTALAAGRLPELPPPGARYVDFAAWQAERLRTSDLVAQKEEWLTRFADHAVLPLPAARNAPPSARRPLRLDPALVARLRRLAAAEGTTLFAALLAAFEAVLSRVTGRVDVSVGTAVAGRSHPEVERTVGLFANPLALRCDLSGDPTARQLLDRVGRTVLDALARQEYPFHEWLGEWRRRLGRRDAHPYSVLFFVEESGPPVELGTARAWLESCQAYGLELGRAARQGLTGATATLYVAEGPEGFRAELLRGDGLDAEVMDALLPRWASVLGQMADDPETRLSALDLRLPGEEWPEASAQSFATVALDADELRDLLA